MKKPDLNLSYHEQDGILMPNIQISDYAEDDRPLSGVPVFPGFVFHWQRPIFRLL